MYFKCSKCLDIDSLLVANIYDGDKRFNVLLHRRQCTPIYKKNGCKLVGKVLLKISSLVNYFANVVAN